MNAYVYEWMKGRRKRLKKYDNSFDTSLQLELVDLAGVYIVVAIG